MPKTSDILTTLKSSYVEADFEHILDGDKTGDA
jgi:hypothetical protein